MPVPATMCFGEAPVGRDDMAKAVWADSESSEKKYAKRFDNDVRGSQEIVGKKKKGAKTPESYID